MKRLLLAAVLGAWRSLGDPRLVLWLSGVLAQIGFVEIVAGHYGFGVIGVVLSGLTLRAAWRELPSYRIVTPAPAVKPAPTESEGGDHD